jgi:hypothetical protein
MSDNIFTVGSTAPGDDYEPTLLNWIQERVLEGDAILRDEPAYDEVDKAISYIMGDQFQSSRPSELANCPDNRLKNILNQTVAALTDIHPLFGFKTYNPAFKDQENTLMHLSQAWWVNTFADLKLGDVIKFAAGVGTGYCEVAWDASAGGGAGDISLRAVDPRDVLPIRPQLNSSIQDWGGVIVRTAKSPEELKTRFPDKAHTIIADNQPSIVARTWSRARRLMSRIISPASPVDGLNASNSRNMPRRVETTEVYTLYLKDYRLSIDNNPRIMGDPATTWSYTVYPVGYDRVPDGYDEMGQQQYRRAKLEDTKLYPRGRMIIATKRAILYDGPNPYWHGMFPIAKLSLDPWPWTLLGLGLVHDLMPIQDALNEVLNGFLDHVRKLLRPAVVADKKSVANSIWDRIDSRLPGIKLKTNQAAGKGVEFVSPEPLPAYTFEFLQWLTTEMDYLSGVGNLNSLAQLQQVPGEDTIEKMQEALQPTLRLKSRLLEYFLREVGEMVKCNFFQFYNLPRRVAMLGDAGIVFNDFDFDPGTMIPALGANDEGYEPGLDKRLSRPQRAQWFHKNFTFQITPNSMLAISQMTRKMLYMQLRKDMLVDRWTLYDVLEVPNGGAPPPGTGQTITDKLMAEMILFMPPAAPLGRPNSNEQPPSLQQKTGEDGVQRQTISTSGAGGDNP